MRAKSSFARTAAFVVAVALAAWLLARHARETMEPNDAGAAIVNGTNQDVKKFPWYAWFPNLTCGGCLVKPDTIWTARHCRVIPGDVVHIGGDEGRSVASVTSYPWADFTVVKLKTPSAKKPIRVASRRPPPNTLVQIMGRGRKTGTPGAASNVDFTVATVRLVSPDEAARLIDAEPGLTADDKNKHKNASRMRHVLTLVSTTSVVCNGDSGGPIVRASGPNFELIGFTDFGFKGCELGTRNMRFSFGVSLPDVSAIMSTMSTLWRSANACAEKNLGYKNRKSAFGKWYCPKDYPWDAGTWANSFLMVGMCAKTQACANQMHALHATLGAPTAPVRHVPGPFVAD